MEVDIFASFYFFLLNKSFISNFLYFSSRTTTTTTKTNKDQDIPLIQHQESKEELRGVSSSSRKMIDLSNADEQYIPETRGSNIK
jgi:hypothetical protein